MYGNSGSRASEVVEEEEEEEEEEEDENSSEGLDDSQDDDDEDLSNLSDDEYDDKSWIEWFCSLKGHEFFVEVEEDFIKDDFNLTGLTGLLYYDKALDVILDNEDEDDSEDISSPVERAAPHLYGLIHARFILTTRGLQMNTVKFTSGVFGQCPNALCGGQNALPVGVSDTPKVDTCKLYCPKCKEMYTPSTTNKLGELDGAYFGTTFAPLFCMLYPSLMPKTEREIYIPRIYGFRVSRSVKDRLRKQPGDH